MYFAHYETAIPYDALAENLVNSMRMARDKCEHLESPKDLDSFLSRHGIRGLRRATAVDLEEIRKLRTEVRKIFGSLTSAQITAQLNRLLASAGLRLNVGVGDGGAKLNWIAARSSDLPETVRSAVALNLAFALERFGFDRLGVCQSSPCRDVFVDTSKRGGRRFCGPTCASRFHVSRYRERHRGDLD